MIRHVVLMRFKPKTTPTKRRELELAFVELKHTLPLIQGLEWGLNNSSEGLDKGYTHCFFVTFSSADDRDAYLSHPLHQAFVGQIKPWLDDVLVIDYEF